MDPSQKSSASALVGHAVATQSPSKVVPLLSELARAEDLVSLLAMRLDPIVNHVPSDPKSDALRITVTARLNGLGDALQYLLDNIEL